MGSRTISVPQRSGMLAEPMLYETISRMIAGINSALTVAMAPSAAVTPSGTLNPTNPVVRLNGPGTIRTIGPVDFDVPIYLIAGSDDVQLETGGNIGSAATVLRGTACALVREAGTGAWWPIAGSPPGIGGTMTPGYVPVATAVDEVADSPLAVSGSNVGLGVDAPEEQLHVRQDGLTAVLLDAVSDAPQVRGRAMTGSFTSPTAVVSGQVLLEFVGVGMGATVFSTTPSAAFSLLATEDWTDTARGARVVIWVTPNGSASPVRGLLITGAGVVEWGNGGPIIMKGTGTPEGVVAAVIGSIFMRTDGGAGTSVYVKESNSGGVTGWVGK